MFASEEEALATIEHLGKEERLARILRQSERHRWRLRVVKCRGLRKRWYSVRFDTWFEFDDPIRYLP
jgi:hypothetical protein